MIIQGDNGTILKIKIEENGELVDLSGATVDVIVKVDQTRITKTATITGLGECEVALSSADLLVSGFYSIQATVNYSDGNVYSSNIDRFTVGSKI